MNLFDMHTVKVEFGLSALGEGVWLEATRDINGGMAWESLLVNNYYLYLVGLLQGNTLGISLKLL